MFLWLYNFKTVDYVKDSYILTREQLLHASELRMKITNSKLYDIFLIIAKALGNEVSGSDKKHEELPKASFAGIENFLSGG